MQWYYTHEGEVHGPVEKDRLADLARQGELQPDDFVWNETMGDKWRSASTILGLFGERGGDDSPPPLPPDADPVPAAPVSVSCTAPVGPAWQGMIDILFRPFELGKWFVLGFVAWIAAFGQSGSPGSGSYSGGSNRLGDATGGGADPFGSIEWAEVMESVRTFFQEFGGLIALFTTLGVVLVLGVWILVLWLQSRMQFVLLDDVVHNRAVVKYPWDVYAQHGNSLFRWNLVFGLICGVTALILLAVSLGGIAIPAIRSGGLGGGRIAGIVLVGLLWLAFGLTAGYIARFRDDFIVPIMYKLDATATEAWSMFGRDIWSGHAGRLVLYGLFWFVLSLVAGAAVMAAGVLTCGIGCCLLVIPYIGSVVSLPVPVFFRLYSIEYLRQFGERYSVEPMDLEEDEGLLPQAG